MQPADDNRSEDNKTNRRDESIDVPQEKYDQGHLERSVHHVHRIRCVPFDAFN